MAVLIFSALLFFSAGVVDADAYVVMLAVIGSITIYLQQNEKRSNFSRKLIYSIIAFPITLAVTYFVVKLTISLLS